MPSETAILRNLDRAKHASALSDFPRQKIGAVMILGNKVLEVGFNTSKTSPIQKAYNKERGYKTDLKNNGAIHAEMLLLNRTRNLNIDWSKVAVYIYREHRKNHMPALAKPCPACQKALKERGIKSVFYTNDSSIFSKL